MDSFTIFLLTVTSIALLGSLWLYLEERRSKRYV